MFATRAFVTLAAVVAFIPAALAGPPLICQPFVTDAASPMLLWAARRHWHAPHAQYDIANLTADTLHLLSPEAPVLARMENLRRAALYADRDPAVAGALLGAVLARTHGAPHDARAAALAWFDAGYLLATYRQLDLVYRYGMRDAEGRAATMVPPEAAHLDGYQLVQQALGLAPAGQAEIEFAASLIAGDGAAAVHRARAASAATPDGWLARNLAAFAAE
jgi:hypothetical protein